MTNDLIRLLEEVNEKRIFSLISIPKNKEYISWDNILESFASFLPHISISKKYFWGKDIQILERFGFDIDFEDSSGNTLLFHIFSNRSNKHLSFDKNDILKKTKKLYHNNLYNENILFYMANNLNNVEWKNTEDFLSGQNLIDFIEKNPKFNLHQFNKLNRNLINASLLNNSFPYKLFDYLKEKKVSTTHIDHDSYNLLNFFPLIGFNKNIEKYFIEISQTNDITHKNKFKDNCISNLISFVSQNGNNNNVYVKYLKFIFENIVDEKIPVHNKNKLIETLTVDYSKYCHEAKEIIPLQDKTISFLKFKILDDKFPSKNVHLKKPKI